MRGTSLVVALASALGALGLAAFVHLRVAAASPPDPAAEMDRALAGVRDHLFTLVQDAQLAAQLAAADPAAMPALAGGARERARLFRVLDGLAASRPQPLDVAVRAPDAVPVAWSGRASILPDLPLPSGAEVVVLHGAVTSTLVARVPVRDGAGQVKGLATAERTLAVRRHIRNAYISDFDLLASGPAVQVSYVDAQQPSVTTLPPTEVPHRDAVLTSPQGRALAVVRVTPAPDDAHRARLVARYRAAGSAVALALLTTLAVTRRRSTRTPAVAVALARAVLLGLGWPWAGAMPEVLSSDLYTSALLPAGLLRTPLDLLATGLTLLVLAAVGARALLASASPSIRWARLVLALLLAAAAATASVRLVVDTVHNAAIGLPSIRIWPESATHLAIHAGLLSVLLAATLLSLGALAWAGVPLRARLERVRASGPASLALLALVTVAVLAGLLHLTLRRSTESAVRRRIASDHAAAVLRQAAWRREALEQTCRRLDALKVLEDTLPAPARTGVDELAFALWSSTDLAGFGFSSAIEVQDPTGAVVSRFALNLPSLSGPERALPPETAWRTSREVLRLGSAERAALHASKLLSYHGQVHGALHVYVGEDDWNLPFLVGRDPYSVLFRTAAGTADREPMVHLVAWRDAGVVFSSLERPPARPSPGPARWTRLVVDDAPYESWVFGADGTTYALLHPAPEAGGNLADLAEAMLALTLLVLVLMTLGIVAAGAAGHPEISLRSVVGAVQRRFVLRLFVAFTVMAVLPVAVLQVVLRGFVVERLRLEAREQALERAAVARKVVQDYAIARQAGETPVTDEALVLVASFVQNDLDLFQDGRLLASSKRELYASGLLPERAPGEVHRAIALEGQPWFLGTETIGAFSYLVASVPVALDDRVGVLSIPLPLPQRELEATVQDLSRRLRLASVVFLALAAALAHRLARRISGPIQDLTAATRRVAQGDLEARVTPHSRDELRDLVEAFNTMAGDLDRQRRDLERSNRLAAWAEMARQVAHEVKNPLTPIQLSTEHLRRVWAAGGADFGATLDVCTQTILKQVRTLRGMVTEFSAFARPPAPVLERLDAVELVEELLRPYARALPEEVKLRFESGAAVPAVRADRRLLERAVVNLVENALQAIAGRGTIDVRVRAAGPDVEIEVADDGPGIDPEIRGRIFEPFFSTKTGGSGLGLALVKKTAEDHGGTVALDSVPGATRITLRLPGTEDA